MKLKQIKVKLFSFVRRFPLLLESFEPFQAVLGGYDLGIAGLLDEHGRVDVNL
jgi:hypothetical protein